MKVFRDKETGKRYVVGDSYTGIDERIGELQDLGYIGEETKPDEDSADGSLKDVGGGNYELPNGEKIKGKKAALEALKKLESGGVDPNADNPGKG
ncbi:hypothetical protein D3C86_1913840 [compost metagenome]